MHDVRRRPPQLHLEPPRWLERLVPASARAATLVGFAVAVGLALGELTWYPAPLNDGPAPARCEAGAAASSWAALGLSIEVSSWPEGRQLVVLPDFDAGPPGTATAWREEEVTRTRRGGIRSGRFAPAGSEDACVMLLAERPGEPRALATWPDGRWAAFDRTLSRVDAPGWLVRMAGATGAAPLGALGLLLLATAAWRARRRLTGWAALGCAAADVAALLWLSPWLEVL